MERKRLVARKKEEGARSSIVIPAYNEEENLPKLLDNLIALEKKIDGLEIIVVDDASSDSTRKIAFEYAKNHHFIRVVGRSKGKNGMGAALKDGTKAAHGEFIVWVMADNSDDLSTIPRFIEKLNEGSDMVFGSRYMEGGSSGDLDAFKAFLSSGYTFLTRVVFGIRVHDITNAFRAFRKEVFDAIPLDSDDFAISPEFAIKAQLKGCILSEVPTTYSDRKAGQPKFKLMKMGIAYGKLFRHRF